MSGVEVVKVKESDDGMRLNRWFLKYYPALPMGRLQKLLRTKQIKVDGKKAEANLKLATGQEIRVPPLDDSVQPTLEGESVKSKSLPRNDAAFIQSLVIYQDKDIIALNKPSGLAVQGGSGTERHVDGMLEALKFENEEKPKLVHRIDKDTSGVLLLARNRKTAELLTKAFKEHKIRKTYLALVYGVAKKESSVIKAKLEKIGERMHVSDRGDTAMTEYKVLDFVGEIASLVEASPLTGRTHQIRAHLEYLGTPIMGDRKYFIKSQKKLEGISNRLYLHSYAADLTAVFGRKLVIRAELPDYFKEALDVLGLEI